MIDITASGHYVGDCRALLADLPEACVQTCVTSPPYWGLRDYDRDGQIGLEPTPDAYVAALVEVFRGVRRALRDDGTLWLNLGDSYASSSKGDSRTAEEKFAASGLNCFKPGYIPPVHKAQSGAGEVRKFQHGLKPKDLVGIPWMVAFALRADGWYLRSEIIWAKLNPMPESVTDRPTKAHEQIFLLSKSERYLYDAEAIKEPAVEAGRTVTMSAKEVAVSNGGPRQPSRVVEPHRNKRSVWTVASAPYNGAHFACFPPKLIEPCILAGSRPGDLVLDPFFGSGTTGMVAEKHGRRSVRSRWGR